jgi:hypothetical protein
MARIVALAGDDGRSVKESLWLASERTGLCFRRVRAFRQCTADAWAWEADRLRRLEAEMLRRRAARLEHEIAITKARLATHATRAGARSSVGRGVTAWVG